MPGSSAFAVKALNQLIKDLEGIPEKECSKTTSKSLTTIANALTSVIEDIEKGDGEESSSIRLIVDEAINDLNKRWLNPGRLTVAATVIIFAAGVTWKATVLAINDENKGKYVESSTWSSYAKDLEFAREFRLGGNERLAKVVEDLEEEQAKLEALVTGTRAELSETLLKQAVLLQKPSEELRKKITKITEEAQSTALSSEGSRARLWQETDLLKDEIAEVSKSVEGISQRIKDLEIRLYAKD